MPEAQVMIAGYGQAVLVRYDADGLRAAGGGDAPVLMLQLRINVRPVPTGPSDPKGGVRLVRALTVLHSSGWLALASAGDIAPIPAVDMCVHSGNSASGSEHGLSLTIPISTRALDQVERSRGEGDVQFVFRLAFSVAVHDSVPLTAEPRPGEFFPPKEAPAVRFDVGWCQFDVSVPRSTWAIRHLPALGHGQRLLLEMPLPARPGGPTAQRAVKHLEAAWTAFRAGSDREVLSSCYRAWEALAHDVGLNGQLDEKSFAKLLGARGMEPPKVEKLKWLLSSSVKFNHLGRHENKEIVDIDHRDAEFALILAHLALSYLARQGVLDAPLPAQPPPTT